MRFVVVGLLGVTVVVVSVWRAWLTTSDIPVALGTIAALIGVWHSLERVGEANNTAEQAEALAKRLLAENDRLRLMGAVAQLESLAVRLRQISGETDRRGVVWVADDLAKHTGVMVAFQGDSVFNTRRVRRVVHACRENALAVVRGRAHASPDDWADLVGALIRTTETLQHESTVATAALLNQVSPLEVRQ